MEWADRQSIAVVVSGATTELGCTLIPMIANGYMFGEIPKVALTIVDETNKSEELIDLREDLLDCCFPLLNGVRIDNNWRSSLGSADVVIEVMPSANSSRDVGLYGFQNDHIQYIKNVDTPGGLEYTSMEKPLIKAHKICESVGMWLKKRCSVLAEKVKSDDNPMFMNLCGGIHSVKTTETNSASDYNILSQDGVSIWLKEVGKLLPSAISISKVFSRL